MEFLEYTKAFGHIKYEQLKDRLNRKDLSDLSKEQEQIVTELQTKGVTILPNYYSAEKCDRLVHIIDELISDDNVKKWHDGDDADSRVFASHLHSEEILEFHNDPFLKAIGEAYTENELINSHTMAGKIIAKKNNLGSGGGWHRDTVYPIQYKSIVYLTDVEETNGPFEFLLGSHEKSTILKSIQENNFKADQNRMTPEQIDDFCSKNPELTRTVFTAKKGTVIVVDTSGIHRGMPIQQDKRYALTNYYFLKHQYNKKLREKFEKWF